MIDAYASIGMPVNYSHWSFGKEFLKNWGKYNKGQMGLAYEIVINTDPCVCYLMEENNAVTQALVMAHAAVGHSFVFKNNYLFKEWTSAGSIIDYMFRMLGFEYLGREDFIQVPSNEIQRANLAVNVHKARVSAINQVAPSPAIKPIGFMQPASIPEQIPVPKTEVELNTNATASMPDQVSEMNKRMGDSPACPTCGHITIRSGACYKCMNCGTQTGCS